MTSTLFLVTLGPVQDFIAAARRTRDLWFGSWLLSELSRTAAISIRVADQKAQLIFPVAEALLADEALVNVANKILARITIAPEQLGDVVTNAVRARLLRVWKDESTKNGAVQKITGPFASSVAIQQIVDLIELQWAAVSLVSDDSYPIARRQVEALMTARKATHDFKSVTWGSRAPKSSIDGQRESIIPEQAYPPPGSSAAERKLYADALYRNYRAGPAERLSGVDMLKRHGSSGADTFFASTADIAVRPLLRRLENKPEAQTAWRRYLSSVEDLAAGRLREERVNRNHELLGPYDGGLLLESRLYELFDDHGQREKARTALSKFFRDAADKDEQHELPRPIPYYAILLADGDRMGATINNQSTIKRHVELSRRLSQFAAQARTIIHAHNGALIYAGGDDVLAFVPLHTLLDCAAALHTDFGTTLNPLPNDGSSSIKDELFADDKGNQPTLSVGIAICHQIEPLGDALALARGAERVAKGLDGKNALAITLSKRSGADVTISGYWGELDFDMAAFTTMHRLDILPDGAPFQLRDLAERLTPKSGRPTLPSAAALGEARRIIGRREPRRVANRRLADTTRDALLNALQRDSVRLVQIDEDDETAPQTAALAAIRALADALIVARELAVAADHAGGPLEEA